MSRTSPFGLLRNLNEKNIVFDLESYLIRQEKYTIKGKYPTGGRTGRTGSVRPVAAVALVV